MAVRVTVRKNRIPAVVRALGEIDKAIIDDADSRTATENQD